LLVLAIRALILYMFVFLVVRIMGKRELGQLQPFEFVIAILMADLASTPMSHTGVPIFYGIIPILTLLLAHLLISWLMLKSGTLRKIFSGEPSVLIYEGRIVENAMRKLRYSIEDLMEQLRDAGVFDIKEVEYAILETSGRLNVITKPYARQLTLKDMNINAAPSKLSYDLILDGKIDKTVQKDSGYTDENIIQILKSHNIDSVKKVFLLNITSNNEIFLQKKEGVK